MNRKLQSAAVALALFAATASAEHVYKGLAEDHPDLAEPHAQSDSATNQAARHAETDELDMHHGLSKGNPDLSQPPGATDDGTRRGQDGASVDLHHGFSGSPDLSPPPAN